MESVRYHYSRPQIGSEHVFLNAQLCGVKPSKAAGLDNLHREFLKDGGLGLRGVCLGEEQRDVPARKNFV